MRLRREPVIAAIALGMALALPQPAHADEPVPVTGVVVSHDDGEIRQAVQIADLYPTAIREVVFFLDGDDPADVRRLEFGTGDVVDLENGCNRPEQNAADTTCADDAGQGELSDYVELTLTAGRESGGTANRSCTPAGDPNTTTIAALESDPTVVGLPDDEGVLCVLTAFAHTERDGDNVTQTDAVTFDLLLRFDTVTVDEGQTDDPDPDDDTEVLGTRFENTVTPTDVTTGVLDLRLPRTGLPVSQLLLGGGVLLGAGAVLLLVSGRRQAAKSSEVGS
ncbi:MAG TPA: hypothetical protein VFD41_15490 [Actinomycetales bacterium]|nr:hypothetical protein [Actinomycetales bacterium]